MTSLGRAGWDAIVHFDEETAGIRTLTELPEEGSPLVGLAVPDGWAVTKVTMHEGETEDGQAYGFEVWVRRVE